MKVSVKVPATSANLGPGYDCLGLALTVSGRFVFESSDRFEITGCPEEFQNESNLVWIGFKRVFDIAAAPVPTVHIHIESEIPLARGLGSSSTCVTAGVLAANEFLGKRYSEDELFQILNELEGHPDNAAAALYGSLTAAFMHGTEAVVIRYDTDPRWHFVAIVPDFEVSTHEARKLLKPEVPLKDAVFNLSHTVAMVRALETGDAKLLRAACEDRLHQPLRATLIPQFADVRERVYALGADAFVISGSGSTLLAVTASEEVAGRIVDELSRVYPAFRVLSLKADRHGVEISTEC